ncbi:DUF892 family protein [Natronobacterium lacisalsi]|uniref:DUF892 family protein n=1 Tax=Natronobacterium lacisalsi TaxID=229731 RepID=UPI001EE6FBFA|nr:DUF892 family protein [Halobiforma lacisalsi]
MLDNERDLFVRTLEELYHLERELEEFQPALAEAATDEELEEFYMAHGERTTEQVGRLEPRFDAIEVEVEPGPVESPSLDGLRRARGPRRRSARPQLGRPRRGGTGTFDRTPRDQQTRDAVDTRAANRPP